VSPDPNGILTKDQVAEWCSTPEGRKEFFDWLLAQRIAGGIAAVFSELGLVIPNAEEQMKACAILFHFIRRKPVEEVLDELNLAHRLMSQGTVAMSDHDLLTAVPKGDA
jgi:hypothetical protein